MGMPPATTNTSLLSLIRQFDRTDGVPSMVVPHMAYSKTSRAVLRIRTRPRRRLRAEIRGALVTIALGSVVYGLVSAFAHPARTTKFAIAPVPTRLAAAGRELPQVRAALLPTLSSEPIDQPRRAAAPVLARPTGILLPDDESEEPRDADAGN
jgi:hypothetical protein